MNLKYEFRVMSESARARKFPRGPNEGIDLSDSTANKPWEDLLVLSEDAYYFGSELWIKGINQG
jgi:hypothetical protein